MNGIDNPAYSITIGDDHEGDRQLTVTGSTMNESVAGVLAGLLRIYRGEFDSIGSSDDESTTALAFRAEGRDLAAMVRGLGEALVDDIEHEAYEVHAVQFNGYVRTDDGYAGWGYAFATEGGRSRPGLGLGETVVEGDLHQTTITLSIRVRD